MSALIKLRQARLRRMEELEQKKQEQSNDETSTSTADAVASHEDDENDNDRDANDVTANKSVNLFADALGDDDDANEHDDDDGEHNEADADAAATTPHVEEISDVTDVSTSSASRRRRPKRSAKTKSKSKTRNTQQQQHSRGTYDDDDIDDISSDLSNSTLTSSNDMSSSSSSSSSSAWSLLSTSYRYFDERNEIRTRFGSASLKEVGASSSRRRMTIRARATGATAAGGSSGSGRKTVLIKAHADWPPLTDRATLKMTRLLHNSFSFATTAEGTRLASEYATTVSSHDVQRLMFFAQHHPYYAPSAMTGADICESQGEFSMAHQMIQRAILLYELCCHQSFDFGQSGHYRLVDAKEQQNENNKIFLSLLARHAQMTAKKGCPRTALEICKLVLSLSPVNDPMCILPIIDYYAIRSAQYQWLLEFTNVFDLIIVNDTNMSNHGEHPWKRLAIPTITNVAPVQTRIHSLTSSTPATPAEASAPAPPPLPPRPPCLLTPNLIYSRALARWYIEGADARNISPLDNSTVIRPPRLPFATALDQTTDDQMPMHLTSDESSLSSTVLLAQAISLFPEVLEPLLKLAGLERELDKSEWKSTISAIGTLYAAHPHIDKLVLVFTERSATLWKRDAIVLWLSTTAAAVARRISDGSIPKRAFENVRKMFFPPPSTSSQSSAVPAALRSLQRTSFTDKIPHLPPEMLMAQHEAAMEDDRAEADMMTAAGRRRLMAENGQIPLDLQRHPVEVFIRSLFPQYVVDQVVDQQQPQLAADGQPLPRRGGLVPIVVGEGVAGQEDLLEPAEGDIQIVDFQIDDDDVPKKILVNSETQITISSNALKADKSS